MTELNPYRPEMATVIEIIEETHNIRTLRVLFNDPEKMKAFSFQPGQVGQISVFGYGESTFVINSPPTRMEYLQFSVMQAGEVAARVHQLNVGDQIGVRAPLGNYFPYENMKGRDILFVGGGIAMAPLRTLLLFMLDNRKDYGDITLIYGARTPNDFCYTYEFDDWKKAGASLILTVDNEFPDWPHRVGVVPKVLADEAPSPKNRIAVTCGPPIMIKFALAALKQLGYRDEQVYTTLEKRMKCGIGICGRCNIGEKYVCIDGPVFSCAQLSAMLPEL